MRKASKGVASVPVFEGLESRVLLDGGVSAFVSAGSLVVIGDWFDNDVVVTGITASEIQVASGASATTINGEAGPLTFEGITADVVIALGDGSDTLDMNHVNVPRDLTIDLGPGGDNQATLHNLTPGGLGELTTFTVGRNALILGTYGEDDITVNGVTFSGDLTIDGGSSADDTTIDIVHTTIAGGLTVFLWTATGHNSVSVAEVSIGGDASIYNGAGWLEANFTAVEIGGNLFIQNLGTTVVPAGLGVTGVTSINVLNATVDGNATVNHFAGDSLQQYTNMSVVGSFTITTGAGDDAIFFNDVVVGAPLVGTADVEPTAGNLTIRDAGGTDSVYMNPATVGGETLISYASGINYVRIIESRFDDDLTILNGPGILGVAITDSTVGEDLFILNVGSLLQVTAADSAVSNTSEATNVFIDPTVIGGNLTIISILGDDIEDLNDVSVGGNTYINNGVGASDVHILDSDLAGWVIIANGGGSSSTEDEPAYNTHVLIGGTGVVDLARPETAGTTIGGSLIVVNGCGDDLVELRYEELDKLGQAGTDTAVTGDVIIIGGPDSLAFFGRFSARNCLVLAGAGDDWIAPVPTLTGWFFVFLGEGGATCGIASGSSVDGDLTFLRGSGGTSPTMPAFAMYTACFDSTVGGNVTVLSGGGDDLFQTSSLSVSGSLYADVGPGAAQFQLNQSPVDGNLTLWAFGDGVANVAINGGQGTTVGGDLQVQTGWGDDTISMTAMSIAGRTWLCTSSGADRVDIVASMFTGDVFIRTGLEGNAPGPAGNDVVNIERVEDNGTVSEFVGNLTIRTGACDDAVNIGLAGDEEPEEGLGALGSHAEVHGQFDLDGGHGDDTLDYLDPDNVFDLTPIIVNVETIT